MHNRDDQCERLLQGLLARDWTDGSTPYCQCASVDDLSSSLMACPLVYLGRANSGMIAKRWNFTRLCLTSPKSLCQMRCLLPTFPLVSMSRSRTTSIPWLPSVLGLEKNSCVQSASPSTASISADKLAREFFQRFCCLLWVSHFSAAMYGHFISTRPSGSGVPGMDTSPSGLQARHGSCESTTSPERVIVACLLFETCKNRRYSCLALFSCDWPHLESIQWSGIEKCLYTALATEVVGLRFAIIPKLDAVRCKHLWWYHVELSAWSLVSLSIFIISRLLTLILKYCDTSVEGLGRLAAVVLFWKEWFGWFPRA